MMGDVTRHVVVFLMDMAIERRHIRERHEQFDRLAAVARRPLPLREEVEQRSMRKDDDPRRRVQRLKLRSEPSELLITQTAGIGHIVQGNKVNTFMLESVLGVAERFLVVSTKIEHGIVLTGHEVNILDFELADALLEFLHSYAPLIR